MNGLRGDGLGNSELGVRTDRIRAIKLYCARRFRGSRLTSLVVILAASSNVASKLRPARRRWRVRARIVPVASAQWHRRIKAARCCGLSAGPHREVQAYTCRCGDAPEHGTDGVAVPASRLRFRECSSGDPRY